MSVLARNIIEKTMATVGLGNLSAGQELLSVFFDEIRACESKLEALWAVKNYKDLGIAAHKLAGACGYFGASQLHDQLLRLEMLIRNAQNDMLEVEVKKTLDLLQSTAIIEKEVFAQLSQI
jgi:HPt (histidine-containing phosphotransfer) domain-containing protein